MFDRPSKYWGRFHALVNENRNWVMSLIKITVKDF